MIRCGGWWSEMRFHVLRTPAAQFVGLMFRRQPPPDNAFVCPFRRPQAVVVNTLFMRFTIDVTVLDAGGVVIDTARMRPWRVRLFRHAAAVIETAAGERGVGVWGRGEVVKYTENEEGTAQPRRN